MDELLMTYDDLCPEDKEGLKIVSDTFGIPLEALMIVLNIGVMYGMKNQILN